MNGLGKSSLFNAKKIVFSTLKHSTFGAKRLYFWDKNIVLLGQKDYTSIEELPLRAEPAVTQSIAERKIKQNLIIIKQINGT